MTVYPSQQENENGGRSVAEVEPGICWDLPPCPLRRTPLPLGRILLPVQEGNVGYAFDSHSAGIF